MLDLNKYRERSDLTQEEVAVRLGISQAQYSRLENGLEIPTLEMMRKLISALGIPEEDVMKELLQKDFSYVDLNPGEPYKGMDSEIKIVEEYVQQFINTSEDLPEEEKNILLSLRKTVRNLKIKPNILLIGHYDSGKTRIANHLLRSDILPTKYQPTTKMLTFIKHSDEKPKFLSEEENVLVFKEEMDYLELDDPASVEKSLSMKGGYNILNNDNENFDVSGFIVVYMKVPLLKVCNIIDTPGSGNEDIDNNGLEKVLKRSSNFMDILVFTSRFAGFLDKQDIGILTELIERLPVINSGETALNNLKNLFITATHADNSKTESDIIRLKEQSVKRLFKVLGIDWFKKIGLEQPEALEERIFTFWAENSKRHEKLEQDLLELTSKELPPIVHNKFKVVIQKFRDDLGEKYREKIDFIMDKLNDYEKTRLEYERLLTFEPQFRKLITDKRMELNDFIINDLKHVSRNNVANFINQTIHPDKIESIIRDNFNRKDDAVKDLSSLINQKVNAKIKEELEIQSNKLSEKMAQFFSGIKDFKNEMEKVGINIPFDFEGAFIGGLTTLAAIGAYAIWASTLGNLGGYILVAHAVGLLSALGISVGGGTAATTFVSLLGGPIVFALGISLLIGFIVFSIFGKSWQKRLAEKFVESWNREGISQNIFNRIELFWDDTIKAQNVGLDALLNDFQEKLNLYRELTNYENKEKYLRLKEIYERVISFFNNLPIRG